MANLTQIIPVAAVRRDASGQTACVVRWILGTGEDLPAPDDIFDVTLTLASGPPPTPPAPAPPPPPTVPGGTKAVSPRLYAMLDPSRLTRPLVYAGGGQAQWNDTTKPTSPIDPQAADSGTLNGQPLGVAHLLAETQVSRVQWRLAAVFRKAAKDSMASFERRDSWQDDKELAVSAHAFAAALIRTKIRPRHLPVALLNAREGLLQHADALRAGQSSTLPAIFHHPDTNPDRQFAHAALVTHVVSSNAVRELLDDTSQGPQQTRQQIRLRALHGGELIDYWAAPDGGTAPIVETDRGKRYPAAELIGCGCTIPLSANDVNQWIANNYVLNVQVTQRPAPNPSRNYRKNRQLDSTEPGDVFHTRPNFSPGTYSITTLCLVQTKGSSVPPMAPSDAYVNYAMDQSDSVPSNSTEQFKKTKGPALGYATGDGKVEIYITAPLSPSPATGKSVAAFNVYGMWEGPGVQNFFDDPTQNPKLAQLKPWLITRRYSYGRDLQLAFPDVAPGHHPAVIDLLSNPPWQPVLQRPDRVSDQSSGANETMPDSTAPNATAFSVDLRQSMAATPGTPANLTVNWDMGAPADTSWSAERKRDGSAAGAAPQRYRFWVTSVDAFEQESAPVPVRTNDVDAGQTAPLFCFTPVHRAPLLSSPGDQNDASAPTLTFDATTQKLTLQFQSPYESNFAATSQPGSSTAAQVNSATVQPLLVIWRRRLKKIVDQAPQLKRRLNSDLSVPNFPQWVDANTQQANAGWELFAGLQAPVIVSGYTWQAVTTPLTPKDSGWEYCAGVGFQIDPSAAAFWAPNIVIGGAVLGRHAYLSTLMPAATAVATASNGAITAITVSAGGSGYSNATVPPSVTFPNSSGTGAVVTAVVSGDSVSAINVSAGGSGYADSTQVLVSGVYALQPTFVNETPAASDVLITSSVAVPNLSLPRAPLPASSPVVWLSAPVLPPPNVQRDLVLLRLLTQSFNQKPSPVPAGDWKETLTQGQIAMCTTALQRIQLNGVPLDPEDPKLQDVRNLFVVGFQQKPQPPQPPPQPPPPTRAAAPSYTVLRQHMTLGFRGCLNWGWSYTPLESNTTPSTEAEAVRFRVYSIRAPWNKDAASTFATLTAQQAALQNGNQYQFVVAQADQDKWQTIGDIGTGANLGQPTLVSIWGATSTSPLLGNVIATSENAGTVSVTVQLRPEDQNSALPTPATLQFFAAQTLLEKDLTNFTQPSTNQLVLPIGGGDEEAIAWWIAGVSAQARVSSRSAMLFTAQQFATTIEPESPAGFIVSVPTDISQFMDPTNGSVKPWVPTDLTSLADAKFSPRLVMRWNPPAEGDLLMAVDRLERAVAKPTNPQLKLLSETSPWQSIKNIETAADTDALDVSDLHEILPNWLLGAEVDTPDSASTEDSAATPFIDFCRNLSATKGVIQLNSLPGFIDYYGSDAKTLLMDANWEYSYRLRAAVDLGKKYDPKWRYLQSRPTIWTSYLLPETPPISVLPGTPSTVGVDTPTICIRIISKLALSKAFSRALAAADPTRTWQYRIVVRRLIELPVPQATAGTTEAVWIDIGQPTNVTAGSTIDIFDKEVERAWPGQQPIFNYRVLVQQFKVDGSGPESLIRSFDLSKPTVGYCDIPITLTAPSSGTAGEVRIIQEIQLDSQ